MSIGGPHEVLPSHGQPGSPRFLAEMAVASGEMEPGKSSSSTSGELVPALGMVGCPRTPPRSSRRSRQQRLRVGGQPVKQGSRSSLSGTAEPVRDQFRGDPDVIRVFEDGERGDSGEELDDAD